MRSHVTATLGIVLALGFAPSANAQIVNTLKGWSGAEPGWSGEVEGRFAIADGNSNYVELAASGAAQILSGRHRLRALASETLRTANGEEIAEDFLLHVRHNWRVAGPVHSLLFVQNQFNPFRRLERRTLVGMGGRWDVVSREDRAASIGGSWMLESERLTDEPGGDDLDHRMSWFLSLVGQMASNLRADVSVFYQPRIADPGDARAYAAASARVDVVGGLDLLVSFDLLHDSDPPEGVEKTDLTLSSGLVLSF